MITVTGLHKRHGAQAILTDLSLHVPAGTVAAIIGPSGGGKSTFLRCLNGLEPFQAGSVRVGEHTLPAEIHPRRDAAQLQAVRRTAGFVFQQFHLFPHLSVLDNLLLAPQAVGRERREEAEPRARALLERVGLADKAAAAPASLSGGQQQRVAIARTLMMRPAVVLFDEPTSALDPVMADEVARVIADLAAARQTMVVVTHAMSLARRVADQVHVFADGGVVESGSPDRLFDSPQHPVTAEFLRLAR